MKRDSAMGARLNGLWAELLLEELYRLGVRELCLAPGSRSAPLTLAAAAHPGFTRHVHFDERGLGFLALGLAKGHGRPVALITTSGTAVANLYPALIEARLTGVPLILLTADRPAELLDCGANQAILQAGIFVHYPVYQLSLPAPSLAIPASFVLSSIDLAWQRLCATPGPVHLNCPYPEPLYPPAESADTPPLPADYLAPLARWQGQTQPWTRYAQAAGAVTPEPDWLAFSARRGVLLVGQLDSPAEARAIAALASRLGWPLLADVQSQLRFHPQALTHYDLALQHAGFRAELGRAEVLLQVGGRHISKRLNQFIADHRWVDHWQLAAHAERLDPGHQLPRRLIAPIQAWCRCHQAALGPPVADSCWHHLQPFERAIGRLLEQQLADFSEAAVCHRLNSLLQGQLFLGNSLPARLMDMLGRAGQAPSRIASNRGASGIDGLIASAVGLALSRPGEPTTLLIGDTSALHDLNSLALLRRLASPFVLLLLNNDGGSIFHLLPVPATAGLRDDYYRLPHGLHFEAAAGMFGLDYASPQNLDEFESCYRQALQGGRTLIEIRVPSAQVAAELRRLGNACRELAC